MWVFSRLVFVLLLLSACVLGQDRGSITGIVTDSTGAMIVGASVTARNLNTGFTQSASTGATGSYSFLYMPLGSYSITAEMQGFRKAEARDVEVNVNSSVRLDMHLSVGGVEEIVEVSAEAPLLETEGSNMGKVMPTKAIQDLPLGIGGGLRSTTSFIILTPGVIGDSSRARIGGGLMDGQSQMLDGAEAQSERRNDPAMSAVSVEALQEFKVQSSAYSAEFGRTSNGVVNFATKSGTNELHGTAFLYLRNEALNARGFTFQPAERPVRRQTNPGFSVGGPVYIPKFFDGRNKAFFFVAGDISRYRSGANFSLLTVPIEEFRQGDFRKYVDASGNMVPLYDPIGPDGQIIQDAFARPRLQCRGVMNVICPERIDPTAQIVQSVLPAPGDPSLTFNNTQAAGGGRTNQAVYSVKGDYIFTEKHRLSALVSRFFSPGLGAISSVPGVPPSGWTSDNKQWFYRFNYDFVISPTMLNHLTVGFNHRNVIENPGNTNDVPEAWRQAVQIPGTEKGSVPGKSTRYNTEFITFGTHVDTDSTSTTLSINEQLAWIKGNHTIKTGFQYVGGSYGRIDCNTCPGSIDFSSSATGNPGISSRTGSGYASFLLGLASGGSFNYGGDIEFVFPYYGFFVQDDWKVTNKLTLNIGLRYELPIPKEESNFQNSNFNPHLPNPAAGGILGAMEFAGDGPGRSGKRRFGETRKNGFGPRFGIAYQLTSRTILRAGGAIYYQPTREDGNADNGIQGFAGGFGAPGNFLATGISYRLQEGFNTFKTLVDANRPPVIDPGIQLYGSPFYMFEKTGRAPYFTDWNFTIDHSFTKNSVFRASWHANLGNKLLSKKQDLNQLDPAYWAIYGDNLGRRLDDPRVIATGFQLPYASYPTNRQLQQALRPFPQYNSININAGGMNDGHMTFHALETSFEHRFSGGLFFMANYTFAKLISNTDGEDANRGDGVGMNQYNRALDKTVGVQDTPHNVAIVYVYELPIGKGQAFLNNMHPVANAILGNWRVSGIHRYVSGRALSITSGQNLFGAGSARASFAYPFVELKNPDFDRSNPRAQPYLNPQAFRRPNNMEYGNTPRRLPYLREDASLSEDIALLKEFGGETRKVEFRATMLNVGNRHRLGGIDTNLDSSTFGFITDPMAGITAREVQFGIKLFF